MPRNTSGLIKKCTLSDTGDPSLVLLQKVICEHNMYKYVVYMQCGWQWRTL